VFTCGITLPWEWLCRHHYLSEWLCVVWNYISSLCMFLLLQPCKTVSICEPSSNQSSCLYAVVGVGWRSRWGEGCICLWSVNVILFYFMWLVAKSSLTDFSALFFSICPLGARTCLSMFVHIHVLLVPIRFSALKLLFPCFSKWHLHCTLFKALFCASVDFIVFNIRFWVIVYYVYSVYDELRN